MVRLAQTVILSCTETNSLQREKSENPHDPCHLAVLSGASKMIFEPKASSMQTMRLSCVKISTTSKWAKMTFQLSLVS
jgi:hypothetical protein